VTDADGREGLPSLSEKINLLKDVRRRPDGSRWRGPTDIRADLLALPGGLVEVDYSASMIAAVINGKQPNPGALLLAGLAALFDVPVDYLLPPVSDRAVEVTMAVHEKLLHEQKTAGDQPLADCSAEPAAAGDDPDWITWTRNLTLGVKQIADNIAAELGLTPGQAEILLHLAGGEKPSVSMAEMIALCHISSKTASTTTDLLQDKGLLRSQPPQPGDPRNVRRVALTDHAREIVANHTRPPAAGQHVLDSLSVHDLEAAQRLLLVMTGRARSASGDPTESLSADTSREPPVTDSARGVA
jgi:DNA-binding MarR family transcriptional regulator/transcriptional regulator with XRE-family HTH domain